MHLLRLPRLCLGFRDNSKENCAIKMSSSNQICENGGLMRPPYRVKYPSGESYPKVRISGDTSGDLTLQVLLSSRQDDRSR